MLRWFGFTAFWFSFGAELQMPGAMVPHQHGLCGEAMPLKASGDGLQVQISVIRQHLSMHLKHLHVRTT